MTHSFAIIADPIATFDTRCETTFYLLAELTRRDFAVHIMEPRDVYVLGRKVFAKSKQVKVFHEDYFRYELSDEMDLCLNDVSCVFLRKDPPMNQEYFENLSLLTLLEGQGPLLVNRPSGILKSGEKISPLRFDGLSPETIVSSRKDVLLDFLKTHPRSVLKPLGECGGRGILILSQDDPNHLSLLEISTVQWSRHVVLQDYVPDARTGDKRILLWKGESLGAFLRVPSADDFRGNMHSGAQWTKSQITSDELKKIAQIKPYLLAEGLHFVGLDFLGSSLTEVNVTSPMGIHEINQLDVCSVEKRIIEAILALIRV